MQSLCYHAPALYMVLFCNFAAVTKNSAMRKIFVMIAAVACASAASVAAEIATTSPGGVMTVGFDIDTLGRPTYNGLLNGT